MKMTTNTNKTNNTIKILATSEIKDLAQNVFEIIKKEDQRFSFCEVEMITFTSKEMKPKIPCSVRHEEVYLFHSLYHPDPNTAFMRLFLTIDAISRASAKEITLVLPYMTYLRQDRKDEPRVPISARLMANLIESNPNVKRIVVFDTHSDQAQGFYNIPVDNLYGALVQRDYFKEIYNNNFENVVVVSPDHGGTVRARRFAKYLGENVPIGIVDKKRSGLKSDKVEMLHFLGPEIKGKDVLIFDDMIDTGGSIINACKMLVEKGANKVYALATHGVFSAPNENLTAEKRLRDSKINVVVTDTIPRSSKYREENESWLRVISCEKILAKAILESSKVQGSVSSIFK